MGAVVSRISLARLREVIDLGFERATAGRGGTVSRLQERWGEQSVQRGLGLQDFRWSLGDVLGPCEEQQLEPESDPSPWFGNRDDGNHRDQQLISKAKFDSKILIELPDEPM